MLPPPSLQLLGPYTGQGPSLLQHPAQLQVLVLMLKLNNWIGPSMPSTLFGVSDATDSSSCKAHICVSDCPVLERKVEDSWISTDWVHLWNTEVIKIVMLRPACVS